MIPLRVSQRLLATLVLAHLLAVVAILPLVLSWPLRLAMIGLVVASLVYFLERQSRPAVVGLHLGAQGELEVDTKVGVRETATILPQTAVLSRVIVLRLRKNGQLLTLPLLPDTTGETAYRQLSLWLKWRARLG
ncbi:MAG: hypothetical protein KKF85_15545 [Gammaproteobacteria bacterium]|nr:hypothetical protein [Rhodocyclaceae bacterium]MBU3907919.1 hypothetical protein [Gammaproteobacteria bacterium]MBU3989620.1 hypothetical protein [Gammaproteobacteria bacterium]MBU4003825.1 hypothetical protein [Gammaproteobacteria bacterium]MBU4021703.1 hypothetical protein [Gammaproteobacteria bacterium]